MSDNVFPGVTVSSNDRNLVQPTDLHVKNTDVLKDQQRRLQLMKLPSDSPVLLYGLPHSFIHGNPRFSPAQTFNMERRNCALSDHHSPSETSGNIIDHDPVHANLSEVPLRNTDLVVVNGNRKRSPSISLLSPYLNGHVDSTSQHSISSVVSTSGTADAILPDISHASDKVNTSHTPWASMVQMNESKGPRMPNVEDGLSSGSDLDTPICRRMYRADIFTGKSESTIALTSVDEFSGTALSVEGPEVADSLVNPPLVRDIFEIMSELKQALADERILLNRPEQIGSNSSVSIGSSNGCSASPSKNHSSGPTAEGSCLCTKLVVQASVDSPELICEPSLCQPNTDNSLQSYSNTRPNGRADVLGSSNSKVQYRRFSSLHRAMNSCSDDELDRKCCDESPAVGHAIATFPKLPHQPDGVSSDILIGHDQSASSKQSTSSRGFLHQQHTTHADHNSEVKLKSECSENSESDEDTRQLLTTQCQSDKPVYIPELRQEAHLQLQRRNRVRDVSIRHPNCPDSLINGVLFRARYLGSTQLNSERQSSRHSRMVQAQEAVNRIKAPEDENQPSVSVHFFVSTSRLMILNNDLQEILIDHELQLVSYIADIGELFVLMARRPLPTESTVHNSTDVDQHSVHSGSLKIANDNGHSDASSQPSVQSGVPQHRSPTSKLLCHVLESPEARIIAQTVGHAFQLAYLDFLRENGVDYLSSLKQVNYEDMVNQQEIFCDELTMFSDKERHKQITVPKQRGEPLGVVVVASGWGSLLPSVLLANMNPMGPAARCGQLNIGNHIISVNGQSLVGLPVDDSRQIIKACRSQTSVKLVVVDCPPVVEVLIRRPSLHCQLGFSVQDGVICSLLRGGIAERGGIRVDHRIIEINGQSVVAVPHEKIVQLLASSVGEIHIRTMPTSVFRLLTGQDTPHYI